LILDVTSLTPAEAAAFFKLGELDAPQLREIALAWLDQGFDARDLAVLASEPDPIMSDVGPMFERVLRNLGAASPPMEDARRTAEAIMLRDIIGDQRQTSGKVWQFLEMFYYAHFSPEFEDRYAPMIGLFYSAEEAAGANVSTLEQQMREEASRLLSTHERASS